MGYHRFGLFLDTNLDILRLFVCSWRGERLIIVVDPTCRFLLTAGGNRGWGGSTTDVVLGYEINVVP